YICQGDCILFSNDGHSGSQEDFYTLTGEESIAYQSSFDLYGEKIDLLILKTENSVFQQLEKHMPLILFLVIANLLLPVIMVSIVNKSFTQRLWELGAAFDQIQEGTLQGIENVRGKDEIGILMQNYNRMVKRMNDLIKRVYKDRLEKQEIDLARQNAELLALHSQINPHFLFNVLESIRMRSLIQGEEVTAGMIEKLAILERQNINWASDHVKLEEEMSFVEAYLELQQYRFGNRLRYEIDLPKVCADYYIPKLTLTTFVENACVHGMEKKTSTCWIYVRVYLKGSLLCIEIEDTGSGMEEEAVQKMNESMRNCSIDDIKENKHVGIINACLRLKMFSEGNVKFFLESETGVGTFMTIKVESEYLQEKVQKGKCDDEGNVSG
ncbi:MAG: histidine kinase, partial [Lachnospiraceae bacterium]|nr:histidine kinase [Lachnospiraceae bacterium]